MNKTRISIGLLFGMVVTLLIVACESTPIGYVNGFERFVIRIEKNASNYTQEQWKRNDGKLQDYVERYQTEKSKLSPNDKQKVGELAVRYYKVRVKSLGLNFIGDMGLDFIGEIGDWLDIIEGFIVSVKKDVNTQKLK